MASVVQSPYLLSKIHEKINPAFSTSRRFEQVVYLQEKCSVTEFFELFPKAKHFPEKETKLDPKKFKTNKVLYKITFTNVRQLDYLFGADWEVIYNGKSVGVALPTITFRLRKTTLWSHKTLLSDNEDANTITYAKAETFHTLSATIHRGSFSRWGSYDEETKTEKESDWKTLVDNFQRDNIELVKRRKKK